MFATLAAARAAAAESFASDHRISALYFEVAGREVRIARADLVGR